ncbi:putative murein hydrolase (TIGR00659 family) [Sinobacterium caligoides]|uniref:Putative murein hydrolase (TIGR00659 family) n=1 Tax=Sinobacterium caligoides TaxID=933926 RepID=A0A3N2DQA7_9GAMM|nr:LrgB family protein [Sinobacterium caligoides]ROS01970.1 putative murein hydrolase (TIGR00659 family) [Sinobacterium caligoides]
MSSDGYSLLHSPLFALVLTLAAFQLSQSLYNRAGKLLFLHPMLVSVALVALVISLLDIPYRQYFTANTLLYYMLGPATVALALPLYLQFRHIRSLWWRLAIVIVLGASVAAGFAVAIAWFLGGSLETLISLAPKSVTTPIAMGLADELGGVVQLAAGAVIVTGIAGIVTAPLVFRLFGIDDDRIKGVIYGLSAHGVGTARAFELSQTAGAFSSLALGLTGLFTALVLPLVAVWFLA